MFAFLAPYKLLIEIAIIGSLVGGAVWGVHSFLEHEREIGRNEVRAEMAAQHLKDVEAARKTELDLRKQLEDAQNAANQRGQAIAAATAAANTSAGSLRDALGHIRDGVPNATAASLASSVGALTTLLGDCSYKYREMGEIADRWESSARQIRDAWPRYEVKKEGAK